VTLKSEQSFIEPVRRGMRQIVLPKEASFKYSFTETGWVLQRVHSVVN
jgi:hypothetical protein